MTDGILLIDKPQGFTSFDVVAKLRSITGQRRIGHTGTLDPMATGVLPCLFGRCTKLADLLPEQSKTYVAGVKFGIATDTQDMTGHIVAVSDAPLTADEIQGALPRFTGRQAQVPPMYSAVSIHGTRLYKLARSGLEIERPSKEITVHSLAMTSFNAETNEAFFEVCCSKGTYVRTLFCDFAASLGSAAALFSLRRTAANGFDIAQCITLQTAQELHGTGRLAPRMLTADKVLYSLAKLCTGPWQAGMLQNGVKLSLAKLDYPSPGRYSVWSEGRFLGLGFVDADGMELKSF